VLLSGTVKLLQLSADGQQSVVWFAEPGEPFGYEGLFGGAEQRTSAEAAQDSLALVWNASIVMRIVVEDRVVTLNALRLLAERLQRGWDHVRPLRAKYVEQRLARGVLQLVRDHERWGSDTSVVLALSHEDLAGFVGTNTYTVSRVFGLWRWRGVVGVGRGRVLVQDPETLATIADGLPPPGEEPAATTFEKRYPRRPH